MATSVPFCLFERLRLCLPSSHSAALLREWWGNGLFLMYLDRMRGKVYKRVVCVHVCVWVCVSVHTRLPVGRICCVITEERKSDRQADDKIESVCEAERNVLINGRSKAASLSSPPHYRSVWHNTPFIRPKNSPLKYCPCVASSLKLQMITKQRPDFLLSVQTAVLQPKKTALCLSL